MQPLPAFLTALIITRQATAQFFVLYGRDSVTMRADPILNPGGIAQHMHDFAGSGNVAPGSNTVKLRKGTCSSLGAANGSSINEDRSAYWAPSLYATTNAGQYVRVPTNGRQIYYKNIGQGPAREPFEFPKGFRMIAGSNLARAALPHTPTNLDNITQWICHAPVWNQGTDGGMPNNVTSCPDYPYFNAAIHFPHCWNGNSFNPKSPNAHVAYPLGDIQAGLCPGTHPIRLPHIFIETNFYLENMLGTFQPNSFVLANGDPTGYGWHADFFNGWTPGVLPQLLTGSTACYSHDVGDCTGATFNPSYPWSSCQSKSPFNETADGPFDSLPGCNPITTQNPAPNQPACAVGTHDDIAVEPKTSTTKRITMKASPTTISKPKPSTSSSTKTVRTTIWSIKTITVTKTPATKTKDAKKTKKTSTKKVTASSTVRARR